MRARVRYGPRHRALRRDWAKDVERGLARCARCDERIDPAEAWDLDHDDRFPHLYVGPSHASCNRAAANELRTSRDW